MIVCGLDIATSTGVAYGPIAGDPRNWRCLAIEVEGQNSEEKADDLAGALIDFLPRIEPAFVAIEMPQRSVTRFGRKKRDLTGEHDDLTINPNALQLSGLAGSAVAILRTMDLPWGLVAPRTWRTAYFGSKYAPREDWKSSAIDYANLQGITLPPTKKAARDAAEAIGIGMSWAKCTFVPARHHPAFMNLRMGKEAA